MPRPTPEEAALIIEKELMELPGSPLGPPISQASTEAEVETPTDSQAGDGTKEDV